jgi:Ca2+-transporting ATPase
VPPRPPEAVSGPLPDPPFSLEAAAVLAVLEVPPGGLSSGEAARRLAVHGENRLAAPRRPGLLRLLLRQLRSPLLYLLLGAGGIALLLGEHLDAAFIALVIGLDASIGTAQEYAADRSAAALAALAPAQAHCLRASVPTRVEARLLVPGDLILLEAGSRVPADVRLVEAVGLAVDESLLTGESVPVPKAAAPALAAETPLAERACMGFSGTLVAAGRGLGVVVATGPRSELGALAAAVGAVAQGMPPLLLRMRALARVVSAVVLGVALLVGVLGLARGLPPGEVLLACVALAVSAVPEGLPVGLTVALAIATRRMGRRHVIVRRLIAVEALGSCTWIASDKTGTLTRNELVVQRLVLPGVAAGETVEVGVGAAGPEPLSDISSIHDPPHGQDKTDEPSDHVAVSVRALLTAAALCNEARLRHDGPAGREDRGPSPKTPPPGPSTSIPVGDAVDVALMAAVLGAGLDPEGLAGACPETAALPFDPARRASASLRRTASGPVWFVKGAPEVLLGRCPTLPPETRRALDATCTRLAGEGYRMLALARSATLREERSASPDAGGDEPWRLDDLSTNSGSWGQRSGDLPYPLVFLGLMAMHDPLRPEAREAVAACRAAGLAVAMVTGDHPGTALAVARELGLAERADEVVTGLDLARAEAAGQLPETVARARVFARVAPTQKTRIVETLTALGEFVAVTGDGANDAPALKAAHVGIAMGQRGTDVAREAASLVLTDDHFASIVAGIEEGRVAYANVRKVTFLLVTTGLTEVVLFMAAISAGLPLPLLPVQLLWLNLVANGLQDVALAFEPAEGGELARPPRRPDERIFDRLMITRVLLVALPAGLLAAVWLAVQLAGGVPLEEARSALLLGFVLLENALVGAARSEERSTLRLSPLRNPLLLVCTLGALGLHVAAMFVPALSQLLRLSPVSLGEVALGLAGALGAVLLLEVHSALRRARR